MKAQSQIISSLLIVIIAITLVSSTYLWGVPIIQQRQDAAVAERVAEDFNPENSNSLVKRMQYISNFGGDELYTISTSGSWLLHPFDEASQDANSLEFSFLSKNTNFNDFSSVGWINKTAGVDCNSLPLMQGTLGTDTSYAVCVKSETSGSISRITYKIIFRDLMDPTSSKLYRLNLVGQPPTFSSTSKSIRITKGQTPIGLPVITELKVLFP